MTIKYFSTFSGIGGFEVGIQKAADNLSLAVECVGFSEIDVHASKVYSHRFPDHTPYGDITKIRTENLNDFDILVGGFPCQSFSKMGKEAGFKDPRGTMFYELARILKDKQPPFFVFENVRGLLSNDKGETFTTILNVLYELGYDAQWNVLHSKNFKLPQNRPRVYLVGYLRTETPPRVFPVEQYVEPSVVLPTLTARYAGSTTVGGYLRSKLSKNLVRRLSPIECERLQGFEDDWTKYTDAGLNPSAQRYKQLGNAVTTGVVEAIFNNLLPFVEQNSYLKEK